MFRKLIAVLFVMSAFALVISAFTLTSAGLAAARDQIRIVGSSTVYPFSSYVAEEFGATTKNPTPIVESTGSGGGHKLFSEGPGLDTPDITNSSRRMKPSEFERNKANNVGDIIELKIGYDGIAVAQNVKNKPVIFSLKDLTLAVAAEVPKDGKLVPNPYKNWKEINPRLPDRKILIYGPPTTSGTRDAFEELVMEPATKKIKEYGGKYTKIRQDGPYVPSGENDNLIVQKLAQDPTAWGIFGYSFLSENTDRIQGASIKGVKPEPETISSGKYPISRSLFFYVKASHLGKVKGLEEYVNLFLDEKMIGSKGYLKRIGLVPLPDDQRTKIRQRWEERKKLKKADLDSKKAA